MDVVWEVVKKLTHQSTGRSMTCLYLVGLSNRDRSPRQAVHRAMDYRVYKSKRKSKVGTEIYQIYIGAYTDTKN